MIRDLTATSRGDSWSASARFITCKKCLRLGKRGVFELVPIPTYLFRQQTRFRWRQQLWLRGVA